MLGDNPSSKTRFSSNVRTPRRSASCSSIGAGGLCENRLPLPPMPRIAWKRKRFSRGGTAMPTAARLSWSQKARKRTTSSFTRTPCAASQRTVRTPSGASASSVATPPTLTAAVRLYR